MNTTKTWQTTAALEIAKQLYPCGHGNDGRYNRLDHDAFRRLVREDQQRIANRILPTLVHHPAEEQEETEKVIGSLQRRISELNEIRTRVVDERDRFKAALEIIDRRAQEYSSWWSHAQAHKALTDSG